MGQMGQMGGLVLCNKRYWQHIFFLANLTLRAIIACCYYLLLLPTTYYYYLLPYLLLT